MNHSEIRHMLSEYIDDAVSPGDRTAIEEHLKTCEKCSAALKELRQTVAVIRSVEEIDPPAWMTQKIMAKVRAEAGEKSWFERFFVPLHIKLPLEAIGILFIAVTALFIYQNREPSMKASSPPLQEQTPGKEQPPVFAKNDELKSAEPSLRSKALPQSPGYKALDMKQEYEKPPQPMHESQAAAPAPSRPEPAEQPALTGSAEKKLADTADSENYQSFLSKEKAGRGMMQARTTTSAGAAEEATVKAKNVAPAAPIAGVLSSDKTIPVIIVKVKDLEAAVAGVEKAIAQVNGSIVRKESPGAKIVFFVTIKAQRAAELTGKLKLLGEIKEQPGDGWLQKEPVELRIEITGKSVGS